MNQIQVSEQLWSDLLASMRKLVDFHAGVDDADLPELQRARTVLQLAERV